MSWLRKNLFSSWPSALATLLVVLLLWKSVPLFLDWALFGAVWHADPQACRAARGTGACWAFVAEKHRFILFGTYPFEQHWRALAAIALLLARGVPPSIIALTFVFVFAMAAPVFLLGAVCVGLSDIWLDYRRIEAVPDGDSS